MSPESVRSALPGGSTVKPSVFVIHVLSLHRGASCSTYHILKILSLFQLLSHVRLFATPWTAACQASMSNTYSQSVLKLMSVESVTPSNHLILVVPFSSYLQSFPAPGSFPMSWFFASGGQSMRAST